MIRSMTAFARAEGRADGATIAIEFKSVNHRALDVVFHLPPHFSFLEETLKPLLQDKLQRGHVTCVVTIDAASFEKVTFNKVLAKDYLDALMRLNLHLGLKSYIGIDQIIHFPGILSTQFSPRSKSVVIRAVGRLGSKAVSVLVQKKAAEGKAIATDIAQHIATITQSVKAIKRAIPQIVKQKTAAIADPDELAAAIKECDINEEIQRIEFHLRNLKQMMKVSTASSSKGKEMDFLVQELQREANTAAAKAGTNEISLLAVKTKTAIEKIREQVQNVE